MKMRIRKLAAWVWAEERRLLLVIFFAALSLRLAVIFGLSNFQNVTGYENEEIALNLKAGRGYSMSLYGPRAPTAFMYPLYTFFLAGHFLIFGKNYLWVEVSQALLGSLSCVLLFYVGRVFFDRAVAALSGFFCAGYPIYVYWTTRAQALTVEVFLLLALLSLLLRALRRERWEDFAAAGAVFGLGVLSKTLYCFFLPALVLWAWWWRKDGWGMLVRRFAVFTAAAGVVIAPWTIRNLVTLHALVPVTSNIGYNLWVGNNPAASGSIFTADHEGMWTRISGEMLEQLSSASDVDKNRIFRDAAWAYIREHPDRFFRLIPARLAALWWFDPHLPSDFPALRKIVFLAVLLPALLGMVRSRRRWRELSLFYLLYLALTLAYLPFFGIARFRYLIEFSFLLFAAEGLISTWRQWRSKFSHPSSESSPADIRR